MELNLFLIIGFNHRIKPLYSVRNQRNKDLKVRIFEWKIYDFKFQSFIFNMANFISVFLFINKLKKNGCKLNGHF